MDHALHVGVGHWEVADERVHPHREALGILHQPGPRSLGKQLVLGREDRIEVIQMLLAASVPEHPVGMIGRDVIGLHRPPIVGDQIELQQSDLIEHRV